MDRSYPTLNSVTCPSFIFLNRLIRCARRHAEEHDKGRYLDSERVFSTAVSRTEPRLRRMAQLKRAPARAGDLLRRGFSGRIAGIGAKRERDAT